MFLFAAPLAAQEEPDETSAVDLPEKEEEEDDDDLAVPGLSIDGSLAGEVHTFNNLDFRELDESSDQAILESDDRDTFGFSSISVDVEYEPIDSVELNVAANHSGLWGSDQLGGLAMPDRDNASANFLWIYELNVGWEPIDNENLELELVVGRHVFSVGGAREDYFFDDIHDGATLELDGRELGSLRLTAGFMGSNAEPRNVSFARYAASGGTIQGFRGDNNTYRLGGVYETAELFGGLEARAFGFYADIGASTGDNGTGADRSYAGALGNFSDEDYTWMAGLRASYTHEAENFEVGGHAEFARSNGTDRKDTTVGLYDVDNEGFAFGLGAYGEFDLGAINLNANLKAFRADGAQYARANGVQYNHGFTSMKGDEIGGLAMDRYAGWHPSSYVSDNGIDDRPHTVDRASGTQFLKGGIGIGNDNFGADFEVWHYMDTSSSAFDQSRADEVAGNLPFGYTQADLEAQDRLGRSLGTELDLSLNYRPNDFLVFYARGGYFIPSNFYEIEVERTVAGEFTQLGSENPANFWAAAFGTSVRF
jgi:hypothetical protein